MKPNPEVVLKPQVDKKYFRVIMATKKHQVLIYYFVTFLISWGGLVIILGGADQVSSQNLAAPFLPIYFMTVAGPVIASLLLTGIYNGKEGYRKLLTQLLKWRVPGRWYAVALLIAPFTVFAALFVLLLISPSFMPGIFSSGNNPVATAFGLPGTDKITLLLLVLAISLFNGLVEEVGWTGFATPRLRLNHRFIASGFNLGIMWGLWHLVSNYIGSAKEVGTIPLPLYLAVMIFSFMPPFRILMLWVYKHTESLFIAALMHASIDLFWMLSMPTMMTGGERITWYIVWAILLWGIVAVIGRRNQKSENHTLRI